MRKDNVIHVRVSTEDKAELNKHIGSSEFVGLAIDAFLRAVERKEHKSFLRNLKD